MNVDCPLSPLRETTADFPALQARNRRSGGDVILIFLFEFWKRDLGAMIERFLPFWQDIVGQPFPYIGLFVVFLGISAPRFRNEFDRTFAVLFDDLPVPIDARLNEKAYSACAYSQSPEINPVLAGSFHTRQPFELSLRNNPVGRKKYNRTRVEQRSFDKLPAAMGGCSGSIVGTRRRRRLVILSHRLRSFFIKVLLRGSLIAVGRRRRQFLLISVVVHKAVR